MSIGSIESPLEGDLSTEKRAEVHGATIWFRIHGLLERFQQFLVRAQQQMFNRRHSGYRGPDPDFNAGLEDLENVRKVIKEEIDRYEPSIRISNSGGGPSSSWQNKILVGVAITVISAVILGAFTTWALVGSLKTQINMYMESTNRRLDSDETRIRDTERRLDRGAP